MAALASKDDCASAFLVDERSSPPAATPAASSSPLRRLLHGGKKAAAATRPAAAAAAATTTTRAHDVKRFICSPFAAVFRAMSCARDAAVSETTTKVAAVERRREARMRRPSLEQLLRMEAPPPPPPASAGSDHHHHQRKPLLGGKPREAPYEVISSCAAAAVKGKEQEPLFPSPRGHFVAVSDAAADDDDGERRRRRTTVVPVKLEGAGGGPGPGRQTNWGRLVVVFASLRACSRAPRINDGKKAAAAGRAPGKAELFYYRPIPMGRRCRVQHLEESPYSAGSDLASLLDLGRLGQM